MQGTSQSSHPHFFQNFSYRSALKFWVRMLLSFSAGLTKTILINPSSTYLLTYLCLTSTCLVHDVMIMSLAINMAPILSTFTMTGWLNEILCFPITEYEHHFIKDKATYSTFELESDALFCQFNGQEISTPNPYSMKPLYGSSTHQMSSMITIAKTQDFPGFDCIHCWFEILAKVLCIQYILYHT